MRARSESITIIASPFFLSVISGLLLYAAFPPLNWYLTGWFAFVPLFYAVKDKTPRMSFILGACAFAVFFALHINWLFRVTVPGALLAIAYLSLFGGLFALASSHVIRRSMDLFVLPFIWTLLEYARTHFLTGFPWGNLAFSQWKNLPMLQIADLTGAWGVAFLMVMTSCALFALLRRAKKRFVYVAVCGFFLAAGFTYGTGRIGSKDLYLEPGPEIRLVQGNIPQQLKWDAGYADEIVNKYHALSFNANGGATGPDIVIWPETAYPYLVTEQDMSFLREEALRSGSALLAGAVFEKSDAHYNSALYFSDTGSFEGAYNKLHLVPFGEYIPFEDKIGFLRGQIDKPIGAFTAGKGNVLFRISNRTVPYQDPGALVQETSFYRFGVLICYEDIFPHIARKAVKEGADFLVNITNDAWFGRTAAAWQHASASVVRAVENRVSVVRAANTGVSCFISPIGKVYSTVSQDGGTVFVEGISQDRVYISRMGSFYTEYGDIFVLFSFAMVLLIFGAEFIYQKSRRP